MAVHLLLREGDTWQAGPAARPELYSGRDTYCKVLKHRPLEMFQFRTVSRPIGRGSLGKEMGKRLGKQAQQIGSWRKCFQATLAHPIYMPAVFPCDTNCRSPRRDGVCL